MDRNRNAQILVVAGREVSISNPDKLLFPKPKHTKLDLVRYYLSVASGALAGIEDRPVVLKRFVNGAEGEAFYQKRAPEQRPDWVRTVTLSFPSGRTAEEIVVDDEAGLAWIVNLGCIELHPHAVRSSDLEHPDELRIDLDPGPGIEWPDVRRVALEVREIPNGVQQRVLDQVGDPALGLEVRSQLALGDPRQPVSCPLQSLRADVNRVVELQVDDRDDGRIWHPFGD